MNALVSIVVDNYNYAHFLSKAVDSALAQEYPQVEVVVVDDGSTDGSWDVITGYADRIVAVRQRNAGQGAALNAGFKACAGDVVLFLDADDELYPTAAGDVVAALGPGVAKVHGALDEVDEVGDPLGRTNPADAAALAHGDVRASLLATGRYVSPVMSGNAYAREVLDRILPMPEAAFTRTADGYLVALAGLHGSVAATPRPLGKYRRHGKNAWGSTPTAASLSSHVDREMSRYRELRREAESLGLRPAPLMELRDHSGLRSRISSLRLAGAAHPVSADTRLGMTRAGIGAQWRHAGSSLKEKVVFTAWFLVVGLGPAGLAGRAITWLYVPTARPRLTLPSPFRRQVRR